MLTVKLLGQFDVRRDGTAVVISSRAAQSLLAYLLLTAGATHRREKLAGLFWPDTSDENARKNLRHELWRLRTALESKTSRKNTIPYLGVDEISIGFNAQSDYWLDVSLVQAGLAEPVSADKLIETLSLYRGELLPGMYDDWVVLERERIRAVFEQKMERLLDLLVDGKRWQETLEWGERWIALGQTPEPAYRALMVAHSAKGNRSQVAAVYERCVQAMRDDLGVEPSIATRTLFEQLSRGERRAVLLETPSPASKPQELTPPAHASNLPAPLSSFIGREKELKEIAGLLSSSRLLTLTGPGGVGKTRSALQAASGSIEKFKDGVWWVDLAPLVDDTLVPHVIAQVLDVRGLANQSMTETLVQFLRSKHLLLVLDNCEHLIDACARLCELLLGACRSLKILVTSREALDITGEVLYQMPTLSLPEPQLRTPADALMEYEGIRLFVERARAVRTDLTLTDRNAAAVLQICQRLDGIPLALELAAARTKLLTVEHLAERLNDRFALLTQGSRTAPPRQLTLRTTLEWSYELLTVPERSLFQRLSVFTDGFALDAAEAVCSGGEINSDDIFELITHLVDKSMVIVRDPSAGRETRYSMLETIRQYAWERLVESAQIENLRERHLEYFLKLTEVAEPKLLGVEQKTWSDRLDTEYANLCAALVWCTTTEKHSEAGLRLAAALWRFWQLSGRLGEGREYLTNALNQSRTSETGPTATRAKALNGSGALAYYQGDYASARLLLEESLEICRPLGDQQGIANTLGTLGNVLLSQGKYATAQSIYEESLALRRELGDQWGSGRMLSNLGLVARSLGELERARSLQEESRDLFRELGERNGEAYTLNALADIARDQGDLEAAHALASESERIYKEMGNTWGRPYALDSLGDIAFSQGDYGLAHTLYRESLELFRGEGEIWGIAYSLESFAAVAAVQAQSARAARLFGAAEALREAIDLPLPPFERVEYDHNVAIVRERIDAAAFAQAWEDGRTMTMEQAIAYALEEEPSD